MEVEDSSDVHSCNSNTIQIMRVIHGGMIALFSDLRAATVDQTLRSYLASLLRGSNRLSDVLIPPAGAGPKYQSFQRQYTAFTTWLFGSLFYVVGAEISKEISSLSMELQVYMLTVLSRGNPGSFNILASEYMNVLKDFLVFHENHTEADSIEVSRFIAENGIIDELDLKPFPVPITRSGIVSTEISILKVILDVGVEPWNESDLRDIVVKLINRADPTVKIAAFEVAIQMIEFTIIDDELLSHIVNMAAETVQSFHSWQNLGLLPTVSVSQFAEVLRKLIETVPVWYDASHLAFEIVEWTIYKFRDSESLGDVACNRIIHHLNKQQNPCLPENIPKYITWFRLWPPFTKVLQHLILNDIRTRQSEGEPVRVREVSKIWNEMVDILLEKLEKEQYTETLSIVKCSSWLDTKLANEKIQALFYDDKLGRIVLWVSMKLNSACSNPFQTMKILFENVVCLTGHREIKEKELQKILGLPWAVEGPQTSVADRSAIALAKSMDVATKKKCLDALCSFGTGKWRLLLLKDCVTGCEIELAIAGILNSILLLDDVEINPLEIIQDILESALTSKIPKMLEPLADVLGKMVCLLSGKATLSRESSDLGITQWAVKCAYCDKAEISETWNCRITSADAESLLAPYFDLLYSKCLEVRLGMSKNFTRFVNHSKIFISNEVAGKWLPYIKDPNTEIRTNVARVVGIALKNKMKLEQEAGTFSEDNVSKDLEDFSDLVIDIMGDTHIQAVGTSDPDLHKTLINTAKEFACVPMVMVERPMLCIFLMTILHPNSTALTVSASTAAFSEVAAFYGITPNQLYIRYRTDLLEVIMDAAVNNFINFSYNLATSVHPGAKCAGFENSRQLLRKDGHFAICFLLSNVVRKPAAKSLVSDFADLISQDEREMFVEFFQYICPYLYLNEDEEHGTQIMRIVKNFTNTSIADLMMSSFVKIFGKLLLYLHDEPAKVIKSLEMLSKYDNELNGSFDSVENVAAYLQPRLHGVLVRFDSYLTYRFDEFTQKTTLASLAYLMRFMGPKYLTPLRYKLLATLRTSLSFKRPEFKPLICEAWIAFIANIFVEELGPLLPTIFVSIVPLMDSYPEKTNGMLEFLIIKNNKAFAEYIPELFFIAEIKGSEKIATIIKEHIEAMRTESTEENLKLWLKRVANETDEIRLRALRHLKNFIGNHRIELNGMILSDADAHPLIVELLDTLLGGCRDKDENIRLASGECLGELGAIEPSLLPRRIVSRDDSTFIFDMNEEFACAVLMELVRAFQIQKSTQSMDGFSLAIQETLRTYDISPDGRNNHLWDELPSTVQQMIHPFLTSHYTFKLDGADAVFPHPIYGSEGGATFDTWAYNWVLSMSRWIREEKYRNVMHAFRPALKHDTRTLIFCIPHIVAYIVANGSERDREKLAEEILAVINITEKLTIDAELDEKMPLRHPYNPTFDNTRISDEAKRVRCSQIVFSILDHLQRWLRERRLTRDGKYLAIESFCNKFDSLVLAQGCYQSHEYHRALIYLEQHMAFSNTGLAESTEGGLLAKIYAQLDEPDGVSGILATQDQPPTLQQLVLAHEVAGQLQDAATCYERLAQDNVLKPKYLQGMVQCYLGLDQPFTAMNITEGVLSKRPELEPLIVEHESFWRLANFSQLNDTKQVTVKRTLLDELKNGMQPNLEAVKRRLVSLLGTASHEGAYQHSYPHIMKLHILNEFEKAVSLMLTNPETVTTILEEWESRGQLVRASRGVESVLSMRRATLDLAVQLQREKFDTENSVLNEEIGKIWLKSAKIARKAGLYQQAYMYILSASGNCPPPELFIEQAQLYWQKGCQEDAFTTLKRSFTNCFQPTAHYKLLSSDMLPVERKQCAKAKLLYAKYNHETLNVDTDGNIANYKEAVEVWRSWEKSLLACAQYYETIVDRMLDEERDIKGRDLQVHMINFYGKSLQYGCKYIHQSMPRMLTIWLNYASRLQRSNVSSSQIRADCLVKMTKIIEVYLERLPTFMWLTAFSQLVSRICHPNRDVRNTLNAILEKLIAKYPQHCMWMMASVIKSSHQARQKRCQELFNRVLLKTPEMKVLIRDFDRLWERLIELSNKPIAEGVSNTRVGNLSRHLPGLLSSPDFSPIMMPTSKFMQLHLPSKGDSPTNWNPFPLPWVHIVGIEDNVTVMASLQRPRRIALKGSDGRKYLFMCKPKDDLRRDFRLMEFNDIVNKYLQKDPESRQRRLYIRTYGVVPLNEECGLIEWLPNLVGFRPILMGIYKERGLHVSARELKSMMCNLKDPLEKKRQVFLEKLLPRFPPVLGDWFRLSFPDPYGWYEARNAYIRTTAVMSMVGYILGLGDRHGENILFDSKCGDCVHVDFNCLFNQGELFDWPERVPFRLTQNMIEAMGPLKYEGLFRRSCQTTMRVLREQTATLLSVLTPFVYDPLVSWNKNLPEAGEKTNEKAVVNIKSIEQRLKGLTSRGKTFENIALNLSVEGQTNHLILEATDVDNLCQMYMGWGPHL